MKYILPQYDMEFLEIPRIEVKENEYISASKVRSCLQQGDWNTASLFLPDTTIEYLKNITNAEK